MALHAQARQPASIAALEFADLAKQCLDRCLGNTGELQAAVAAWVRARNALSTPVHWHFTTDDARIKLRYLYPTF